MTLGKLKSGEAAVITALHTDKRALREKYTSRGIVPGVEVSIVHGGDPVVISLDQSRWAINRMEADAIEVAMIPGQKRRKTWLFGRSQH